MEGQFTLNFGVYKGKSLHDVAKDFPSYLLWIAGTTTKYSLTKKAQELFAVIKQEHPDDVKAAKEFVEGKCYQCWTPILFGKTHFCKGMKFRSQYEYHPYGKRT
jgi:hypothetical protein